MSAPAAPDTVDTRAAELQRLREWLLILLVVTVPLSLGSVLWSSTGGSGDFNRRVSFSPFDVPLLLLLAIAIVDRRPIVRWRRASWLVRVALALAAVLALAFVVHPSPRGVDLFVRVAAGLAVIDAMRRLAPVAMRHVLVAVTATGVFEALLGMTQSAKGGEVGLGPLEYKGF